MSCNPLHLVMMGTCGAGKSVVGKPLASWLGFEFAEGDQYHPQANIDKMSAGQPLDDGDRQPWLQALRSWSGQRHEQGISTVLTCSALKRAYREILRDNLPSVQFIHLHGDEALLVQRMQTREHFMPSALIDSQLNTLEPLQPDEPGLVVDSAEPFDVIIEKLVVRFSDNVSCA